MSRNTLMLGLALALAAQGKPLPIASQLRHLRDRLRDFLQRRRRRRHRVASSGRRVAPPWPRRMA